MGRTRTYRQRIDLQTKTHSAKTLYGYLVSDIARKREIPVVEAKIIVAGLISGCTSSGCMGLNSPKAERGIPLPEPTSYSTVVNMLPYTGDGGSNHFPRIAALQQGF